MQRSGMIEKSFGKNRYFKRIVITQTQPVCGHVRNRKNRLLGNSRARTLSHSSGGSRSCFGWSDKSITPHIVAIVAVRVV